MAKPSRTIEFWNDSAAAAWASWSSAFFGRLHASREFSRRAVESAEREGETEVAAGYEADMALRSALFGNVSELRQGVSSALRLSTGRDAQFKAALAMALAGDGPEAQLLANDLGSRFPEDTLVQFNYLPTLRAKIALGRNDPSKAIETLRVASPYELAGSDLYPVFVRGQVYLNSHQGKEAAFEFQRILDHRGLVFNSLTGALAHLGLARAYALQGDSSKARAKYQDLLALWKDADLDIPILKAAKAEYAELQ